MSKLGQIKKVYFIGIGGIGMSALARYFVSLGVRVSGYDRTETPLTQALVQEGIPVHYTADVAGLPKDVDVVVYTPAIPASQEELVYYREQGYEVVKRSDVLQWITESSFNICVGGTHGKTTVSTMVAHILRHSEYGCNAFLGGIAANYNTNFWSSDKKVAVIEADEYDRSFLKLVPDIAVITAMDPDHLDIYVTPEEVEHAFVQFAGRVKPGGCLISRYGLKRSSELKATTHLTYSLDEAEADVYATAITVENGAYRYHVTATDWQLENIKLHMGGLHNVENSIAAIAVAKQLGIADEKISAAIAAFRGVKRRFEYYLAGSTQQQPVLIDDYAHHPQELKALITGVRSLYGTQKCTIVFQPHLFSRTKDLAVEFAASLDLADEVILLPIYPARELPMEGVTSELVAGYMTKPVKLLQKEELLRYLEQEQPALVVMAGAGDIDALLLPAKAILQQKAVS